ncbi:sirohydrochlorin cobaltochelatase [Photobacterium sp. OFAV2-7]|uniref:sirohydrochlorin cobaltochelatase n=1 Tax=Photobacterium sp. OFAV2-7 TaxID=2917748 RepID=UPI001EF59267|nr:sirohydrochlorin cobaltochelatase [Photobacterium sp. OFAV2-7]MCG7586512.1 sirohydrochlorin cobaltochelatase [Photobacterium sp. OFAV2-7]
MKRLRHYTKGTAIVLSCFGSVVEQKRYLELQGKVAERYPHCEVRIALSSRMVIKKLKQDGDEYQHLPAVLANLDLEGYQRILVVSCYLFPTDEHKQLVQMVEGFRQFSLSNIEYTPAILHHTHMANNLLAGLNKRFESGSDINLFVHHGAPYLDNAGHQAIGYCDSLLSQLSDKNLTCSLEGAWPFDLVSPAIKKRIARVDSPEKAMLRIIPLLLVSGNHFVKDMVEIKAKLAECCDVQLAQNENSESFNLLETKEVTDIIFLQIAEGLVRLKVPAEEAYHG